MNDTAIDPAGSATVPKAVAAAVASAAFLVPFALSRSTSPTPDHPRVLIWYAALRKPFFKPPDVAVPLAWTAIESGLAVAAYRLLRKPPSRARASALGWLAANVVGIGAWSRLFFGRRNLPASTVAAGALCAAGAVYTVRARDVDGVAGAAGIPLTAWVAFATLLTAALWRRNR